MKGEKARRAGGRLEVQHASDQQLAAYDQWWQETRPLMVNEEAPMSPTRPFHVLYNKQLESTGIPDWKPQVD